MCSLFIFLSKCSSLFKLKLAKKRLLVKPLPCFLLGKNSLNNTDYLFPHDIAIEANFSLCAELNNAFFESKEGIVLADTNIATGHDDGAALADDYLADAGLLSVVYFHPKVFWL